MNSTDLVLEAIKLGCCLLLGGNPSTQAAFHECLSVNNSEAFFERLNRQLEREMEEARFRFHFYCNNGKHFHVLEEEETAAVAV